jgi:hypothetical protein
MRDARLLPDLPVPDLDDSPGRSDGSTWRVQARAFRDPVGDAERLAAAFGLELSDAQHLVASAPVIVRERVRREEADRIAAILTGLGARAVVEDTAPAPSAIPSPRTASAPDPAPTDDEDAWDRSFWSELPTAFVAPVLGKGALAIAGCGALGAATWLVLAYAPGIAKLGVGFALGLVTLGIVIEVFAKLAQAAVSREEGALPVPQLGMPEATALAVRGLATLAVLALFGALAWLVAQTGVTPIASVALALLFSAYWPLGLAIQGISGRFTGIIDVVAAARCIAIAPLEYAAVVVVSLVLLIGLSAGVAAGGVLTAGASDSVFATGLAVAFLYFAALSYAHGVLGYAMGALVAAKEERFAFLLDS